MTLPEQVACYEAQLIEQALDGRTVREAAATLGIAKLTLENRIRRYRKSGQLTPRPKNWWQQQGPSRKNLARTARQLGLSTYRKTSQGKWKRISKADLHQLLGGK